MEITFSMLTPPQQRCAIAVIRGLYEIPMALPRIEVLCQVVASAEPLVGIGTQRFHRLTRRERHIAASLICAVMWQFENAIDGEAVLRFLGQPRAITTALNAARHRPLQAVGAAIAS